jgi:diguanylate cyclase (GGDEF)-like protein
MISLRKAMDAQAEEAFHSTLETYRAALLAMADAGSRACPSAGDQLQHSLLVLHQRLTADATPGLVSETEQRLEAELRAWSDGAAQFYQDKTNDVKDILQVVAKAAGEVSERDQRYSKKFGTLTERLQVTTQLNDLSAIRQSLHESVSDIKTCVTEMAKDGRQSVEQLRAQLSTYETRLEEVERIASLDPLTCVANRRKVEAQLERRVKEGRKFSVLYMDLNGFKRINDTFGHLAGDDLLKQFAGELRAAFRGTDLVGRWGGDEFIVLVDGDFLQAQGYLGRVEKWVAGAYTLNTPGGPRQVKVAAAIGVASWQVGDTITDVLRNADAAMYEHKSQMKSVSGQ